MSHAPSARAEIEHLARTDWGRLLAALIADLRDMQLAEECLQDALESALQHWARNGLPRRPRGWVLQVARRRAIDRIRRDRNFARKQADYQYLLELDATSPADQTPETHPIPDERLRLIFTCCHPALPSQAQIALTLRTLCGLSTRQIARAYVVSEQTMAQRLVRAQQKIKRAGIPYNVPEADQWPERLQSVLTVIYLIFNEGYTASDQDAEERRPLMTEAVRLTRIMLKLRPEEPEIMGLLALILLHQSRAATRVDADGGMIPLSDQDRNAWDRDLIAEGLAMIQSALHRRAPGPYQLQAAISAIHAEAESHATTNWQEIVLLYNRLYDMTPNPVILLNRAVALSYLKGPSAGLSALADSAAPLQNYQPWHAAHADMLRRSGKHDEAADAYALALEMTDTYVERRFLQQQLAALDRPVI